MQEQARLMTSRLSSTRLPWTDRSAAVGFSALLLLIPASKRGMPRWKRACYVLQAFISFLSDYVYSGRPHISHGVDRWFITLNALACAPRAVDSGCAMVPVVCYVLSMESIRLGQRAAYEFWHTLWHVFGALCLYV